MNNFLRKFAKVFCCIVAILTIFVIAICLTPTTTKKINGSEYGSQYPFIIDNLILKCKKNSVWVEDENNNIFPLNAAAYDIFKEHANTDDILQKDNIEKNPTEYWQKYDALVNDGLRMCR